MDKRCQHIQLRFCICACVSSGTLVMLYLSILFLLSLFCLYFWNYSFVSRTLAIICNLGTCIQVFTRSQQTMSQVPKWILKVSCLFSVTRIRKHQSKFIKARMPNVCLAFYISIRWKMDQGMKLLSTSEYCSSTI